MKQLLQEICIPRAAGTEGNRKVTEIIQNRFEESGLEAHELPFGCHVWNTGDSCLGYEGKKICVHVSPFSQPVRGNAITREISSVEELRRSECEGKILFLTGKLSEEALQPKDYPFYYPDEHKEIIDLLEEKKPLTLIAVRDGGTMFEDGNFIIPSGYMSVSEYGKIRDTIIGNSAEICLCSANTEITSKQLYAVRRCEKPKGRAVIAAHMDTKYGTPGALDNGAGLAVLMKLAEKVNDIQADIEFVPFNTEEYYGADGELLYLEKMKENNENTDLFINIDSVGHIGSKPAVSFYNISDECKEKIMKCGVDMVEGEPWYAGDHAPFVFMGIPSLAVTSSDLFSGGMEHMHTPLDTVNDVDVNVLEETVQLIHEVLRVLYK